MLLHINLKEETKRMIEKINFNGDVSNKSTILKNVKIRCFIVNSDCSFVGKSVGEFENEFKHKITVEKIFENDNDVKFNQDTKINVGNYITLIGDLTDMLQVASSGLTETSDEKYLNVTLKNQK